VSDGTDLRGRARIAHAVGRSERTISRWIKKGILPPLKDGPFKNSVLQFSATDLTAAKVLQSATPAGGDQGEGLNAPSR
jgi:hypothetical protein